MRSDYYDLVATGDLRPLPPLPGPTRKRRRRALPLFLLSLLLIIGGVVYLGFRFGWQGSMTPPPPPSQHAPGAAPASTTDIRRLAPPGESSLALIQEPGAALSAKEIYIKLSPSVLAITAWNEQGQGSQGTGILFDESGYFVTNFHVIEGMATVEVTLSDGRTFPAGLIGMDEQTDLAVLKLSASGLAAAPFASDTLLSVGDDAYAIGNPLGDQFRNTMTDGIISGIDRNVTVDGHSMTLIQTTTEINSGNSGGALVDGAGRVVGVTNMKMMSDYSTVEGLGFAIPATTVEKIVGDLMTWGHVTGRPMLGVTVRPVTQAENQMMGLMVEEVEPKSDAWAKGIRPGHILIMANEAALIVNQDLLEEKEGLQAGESISLTWFDPETGQTTTADILLMESYQLDE